MKIVVSAATAQGRSRRNHRSRLDRGDRLDGAIERTGGVAQVLALLVAIPVGWQGGCRILNPLHATV